MESRKPFLAEILSGVASDYADIRLEESEQARIVYRGRDLDEIGRAFERGGCIRVFHHGNWGSASFNKVDGSLKELARDVAAQVERMPSRPETLGKMASSTVAVTVPEDEDPRKVPLADKHALIRRYNDILLKTAGITTTLSMYHDVFRKTSFLSTEDRFITQDSVYTGFMCRAVARDGSNVQNYSDSFGKTQGFASLQNREPLVERIGKVALDLLKAEPVQAGKYDVVIDPLLAGVFAHEAFGHLSEADFLSGNERLLELMKVGTRYGVDELTIVDDGTMPGERGSYRFDDEGTESARTELIKEGVIAGHLHDRQSARRMGEAPTGNARAVSYRFSPIVRMSNTFIEPRSANIEDMMDSLEHGLYVCGSRGGMTELESFTFASEYAWLVEHGRKTKLVRDVTLSGNVFETLKNIDLIGDDLVMFGGLGGCGKGGQSPLPVGLGAPHVRIRNVVIGGR
ncbi:MAG: TldD/PmbA family protein [candidate division WOR-3 bacterium]|nr:TldD/PmbA family protein [candidate division WOR-3 bacterium]